MHERVVKRLQTLRGLSVIPPGLLQSEHQSYLPPQAENSSLGEVAHVLLSPLNHIPSPVSPSSTGYNMLLS